MKPGNKKYLLGVFDDEKTVLTATSSLRAQGIAIADVYTPYPVHGLDTAMGIRRSRLPIVCFFAAMIGCCLALWFQEWVFTTDWPMIVGGKPHNALPAFLPVTFELSVLLGGLVTAAAFFFKSRLGPGAPAVLLHDRITDDGFVMAILLDDARFSQKFLCETLQQQGAVEIHEREVRRV